MPPPTTNSLFFASIRSQTTGEKLPKAYYKLNATLSILHIYSFTDHF